MKRLAIINFGGIGDEILFSPVLAELRQHLPDTHITLLLEDRSRSVSPLLPGVDEVVTLAVQGRSRGQLFFDLLKTLCGGRFDAVISSGSSPFIAVMLWASGIPVRVGFESGAASRLLLSAEAPLNRKAYAAEMYFTLATTFLRQVLGNAYQPPVQALPTLKPVSDEDRAWAAQMLSAAQPGEKIILIHPGVSLVSVRKNMLKGWAAACWTELIRQLCAAPGQRVFLLGGPDDEETVQAIRQQLGSSSPERFIDLYGRTENLLQLAALIEQADVLVCVDSSPLHIAVGYGTPVVAMFGPTDEKKLVPADPCFAVVTQPDLACRPCLWDVRQTSCDTPVCLDVPVARMQDAVQSVEKRR